MMDDYWDDDEYEEWRNRNKNVLLEQYCSEHDDWEIPIDYMLEDEDWLAEKFNEYKENAKEDLSIDGEDWKYD
jgi:hypothetical protein